MASSKHCEAAEDYTSPGPDRGGDSCNKTVLGFKDHIGLTGFTAFASLSVSMPTGSLGFRVQAQAFMCLGFRGLGV